MNKHFFRANVFYCMVLLTTGMVLTESCKKNDTVYDSPPPAPVNAPPVILYFTPESAAVDSVVVIIGTDLNPVAGGTKVSFNSTGAIILSATATRIEIKVPDGAGTGKITIQTVAGIGTSGEFFTTLPTVTTVAGSSYGFADGAGSTAQFRDPFGVTADALGNIFVADAGNNRIRKITPAGVVSTIAGKGTIGNANGTAANATFNYPHGVAVDGAGNIFVADAGNSLIRKITPDGIVSTVAGSGFAGFADGQGSNAAFNFPTGLVVDGAGNLFVTDGINHRIRKITPAGVVSTLDGVFGFPGSITIDFAGNLYIADASAAKIYKMTQDGVVTSFAGSGTAGLKDGIGDAAQFSDPEGIAIDGAGNLYVGDLSNAAVRKITPAGIVSTLAGGTIGFTNGAANVARFNEPAGIAADIFGNIYIADVGNSRIRKLR